MGDLGEVFEDEDFSLARLNASVHRGTAFLRCTFRRSRLMFAEFHECTMTGSVFESADLRS